MSESSSSRNPSYNVDSGQKDSGNTFCFNSRRSPIVCKHACVATSQPLASFIGIDLLKQGANAADAAIAIAAALAVTEPCSTGLGGDMFCLFYDASLKQVHAINGSGKAPTNLTLDKILKDCPNGYDDFKLSPHAVTVPGAARGWEDTVRKFGSGKFTLSQLLEPAAKLAEEGFPVSEVTAHFWEKGKAQLTKWLDDEMPIPLTSNGVDTPRAGEIFSNPDMARVLRDLGRHGATEGFYDGATGHSIVKCIQKFGGVMTHNDLIEHTSLFPTPISQAYRDVKLWQVPPNGQGIAALIALSGLKYLEEEGLCPKLSQDNVGKSAESLHVMIEMMRLGFADARKYVTCPDHTVSIDWLMDAKRIGDRAKERFHLNTAKCHDDCPLFSSDTVSFQVVDDQGNAISFVNSNYLGFGSGLVPDGCGFCLQNRGCNFSLDPDHANCFAPGKRPYHTIIPAILTCKDEKSDEDLLYATLSNMGGFMQPQGHLQLTVNMVAGGMNPQVAIDSPRFCIVDGTRNGIVELEVGVPPTVTDTLLRMGHQLKSEISGYERNTFGLAQIIKKDPETGVLWAGSDGRADGCAIGY